MSLKDLYDQKAVKNKYEEDVGDEITSLPSIQQVDSIVQEKEKDRKNYSILNALFISIIVLSWYYIVKYNTDKSLLVYQCPLVNDLDSASRLTKIENGRAYDYENLIKGEVRRFIRARYPKNALEARYMWEYGVNHSTGKVKEDFEMRLETINKTKDQFKIGAVVSVYPSVPSDEAISIRESSGGWNISIPVRRVNRVGVNGDERIEASIKMRIEKGDPHPNGSSSGLYITDYYLSYIPDTISGKEIILEN